MQNLKNNAKLPPNPQQITKQQEVIKAALDKVVDVAAQLKYCQAVFEMATEQFKQDYKQDVEDVLTKFVQMQMKYCKVIKQSMHELEPSVDSIMQ